MKKSLVIGAVASVVMAVSSRGVVAQPPGYGQGMPPQGQHRMMPQDPFANLGLQESQRKAIDELMANQQEYREKHMAMMKSQNEKLRELYKAEKWDADAMTRVYDEMYKERRAMMEKMIETRNAIMDKLNKEQREKMNSMMPQRPQMQQ
jgi:Spy/CpxP family protein refolding chaperone